MLTHVDLDKPRSMKDLSKHKDIAIIHLKERRITWTYATLATQGNTKLKEGHIE